MGVSLSYFTTDPITAADRERLAASVAQKNDAYDWWCECLWVSDRPLDDKTAFGSTKLFCGIDDEDTDTYMAFLDVRTIIDFFAAESERHKQTWFFEIEGSAFGRVVDGAMDSELRGNLSAFLDWFPGDFAAFQQKSREQILEEWADR